MKSRISATEAGRSFSDLLNRIRYRGDEFIIVRNGEEVCRMGPVGPSRCRGNDLKGLLTSLPRPDGAFLDGIEALQRTQPEAPDPSWGS